MNIKILSPKLSDHCMDYDSEEKLADFPNSVFSLDEFISSDLFTMKEKYEHLKKVINKGIYVLKLAEAAAAFRRSQNDDEIKLKMLVAGIKELKKAADDPLGKQFFEVWFDTRLSQFEQMLPDGSYLAVKEFDILRQIFRDLDWNKKCEYYPDYVNRLSRIYFENAVTEYVRLFRDDLETEIRDYLTGSVYFSNRMKKAAFVINASVFEVLNTGFRKSSRSNYQIIITDEERVERIMLFCEDLKIFLEEVKAENLKIAERAIHKDIDSAVLLNISNKYPAFKKYRNVLLEYKVIEIKDDQVFWIYRKEEHGSKTCFANFCEYIAEIDTIDWKFLEESFNFDSKGLAQIISRGAPNNKMWRDLKKILSKA